MRDGNEGIAIAGGGGGTNVGLCRSRGFTSQSLDAWLALVPCVCFYVRVPVEWCLVSATEAVAQVRPTSSRFSSSFSLRPRPRSRRSRTKHRRGQGRIWPNVARVSLRGCSECECVSTVYGYVGTASSQAGRDDHCRAHVLGQCWLVASTAEKSGLQLQKKGHRMLKSRMGNSDTTSRRALFPAVTATAMGKFWSASVSCGGPSTICRWPRMSVEDRE
jgi:hypothetical protein